MHRTPHHRLHPTRVAHRVRSATSARVAASSSWVGSAACMARMDVRSKARKSRRSLQRAQTPASMSARRTLRLLLTLLIALGAAYWAGRELGLGNDELLGYLLLSVGLLVAS